MDPAVPRRRLRILLRRFREAGGMTQDEVASAMDWSISKLKRIENGTSNISTNDLRALLELYRVEPARATELARLAQAAREAAPWRIYRDVAAPKYIEFLGYESSALTIRNFEPLLVPGLLQTEEYARVVLGSMEYDDPETVEALIDLRIQRQDILLERPQTQFHFILDEAVIHRMMGSRRVAGEQLARLRELADYPNITIRLIPFEEGIYPRFLMPYVLLELSDPEDGKVHVLYLEGPSDDFILRGDSQETRGRVNPLRYLEAFQRLERACRPEEFLRFVERAIGALG